MSTAASRVLLGSASALKHGLKLARPMDAIRSNITPTNVLSNVPMSNRGIASVAVIAAPIRSNEDASLLRDTSAAAGMGAPAWSGLEHSDAMEQQPKEEKLDSPNNPTAQVDPMAFRPSGSNAEQIIAGERSPIDPLAGRGDKLSSPGGMSDESLERPRSPSLEEQVLNEMEEESSNVRGSSGP